MIRFFDNSISSNAGSDFRPVYLPKVLDNGEIVPEYAGEENIQEMIQSYAESCDINIILNRVKNGETNLLNQAKGVFGDFTKMPKTLAEFMQMQIDAERMYDGLPKEIKIKFDNDKNKFFATAGSEEWLDKCGLIEKKEEIKVEEVVNE